MLRLYDSLESGNAYKVRLLLTQLGQQFERVELNVVEEETRSAAYRAKNANFRIPMVEWPDGRRLPESNAILFYFANGTRFLPDDLWERAQILRWQNFEQYSHEPYIAVLRFWHLANRLEENGAQIEAKHESGVHALNLMEGHLAVNDFFVGGKYTIADISLYAYTHVCHEGGFDLSPFPAIRDWIQRIQSEKGYISISDEVGKEVLWSDVCAESGT